jgi:hypothetical protein
MATDTVFQIEQIGLVYPVIFYRAYKQEYFAFQRVESVANTSSFVSPVLFFSTAH